MARHMSDVDTLYRVVVPDSSSGQVEIFGPYSSRGPAIAQAARKATRTKWSYDIGSKRWSESTVQVAVRVESLIGTWGPAE